MARNQYEEPPQPPPEPEPPPQPEPPPGDGDGEPGPAHTAHFVGRFEPDEPGR